MSSNRKVPIERRRRNSWNDGIDSPLGEHPTHLRRESDEIKAQMLRWINLADQALGRQREDETRPRTPDPLVSGPQNRSEE